jgi:hypothetical protein
VAGETGKPHQIRPEHAAGVLNIRLKPGIDDFHHMVVQLEAGSKVFQGQGSNR